MVSLAHVSHQSPAYCVVGAPRSSSVRLVRFIGRLMGVPKYGWDYETTAGITISVGYPPEQQRRRVCLAHFLGFLPASLLQTPFLLALSCPCLQIVDCAQADVSSTNHRVDASHPGGFERKTNHRKAARSLRLALLSSVIFGWHQVWFLSGGVAATLPRRTRKTGILTRAPLRNHTIPTIPEFVGSGRATLLTG
jgi:hypothetical protein